MLRILVAVGGWRANARTWARRRDRIVASAAPQEGATLQLQRRVAAKAGKLWQLQHTLVLLATGAGGCTRLRILLTTRLALVVLLALSPGMSAFEMEAYVKAPNAESNDGFGRMALSGDTLAVGA